MEKMVPERSNLSRRAFLIGSASTVGTALLAACGGAASPAASSGAGVAATTAGSTVVAGGGKQANLRWSMWSATQAEVDQWQELAADVTKAQPNIKVTFETAAFADYWDKLQTQLASQTEPDLIAMQSLRMPPFAVRKALRPLKPYIDKDPDVKFADFFKSIEDALSFKGDVYAFGYDLGPIILYYNKDLFDAAGVPVPSAAQPMTWEQFRDTAKKLTKPDAGQYGLVVQPNFDNVVPWLWSNGGDYMNADETTCTLNAPDSQAALEYLTGLITKDKVGAPITDLANANFASEAFYGGKIGMYYTGPWNFVNVRKNAKFAWDIAPMPQGKAGSVTYVAGSGFGISNTTKSPDEAWQALKVLTSNESLQKLAKGGRAYPARQSAVPAIVNPAVPPKSIDTVQQVLDDKIAKTRFYKTTTTWQETSVMLTQDFNPVYLGQQSVADTVAKVKPKFDELLKKHQDLLKKA